MQQEIHPSTTKYSCTRSNKGPDLIKSVDLTIVYRKYRGWKSMLMPPCRCSQPNPKCGKFQRTLDPISSISKQQAKKLKPEGRSPRFKEISIAEIFCWCASNIQYPII